MRKKTDTITKNLTFRSVVIRKAEQIQSVTGEEFSVLTARLINEAYDRSFPCECRKADKREPRPARN